MLIKTIDQFAALYGESELVYNVHNVIHLCDGVRLRGSMDAFSAFPYGSYLSTLKHLLHLPTLPASQLFRRFVERAACDNDEEIKVYDDISSACRPTSLQMKNGVIISCLQFFLEESKQLYVTSKVEPTFRLVVETKRKNSTAMRRNAERDISPVSKRSRDRSAFVEHRSGSPGRFHGDRFSRSSLRSSDFRFTEENTSRDSTSVKFRTLCVRKFSSKLSIETLQEYLFRDFSKFGDMSISVGHLDGERAALITFKWVAFTV
ncbi:hypothetical protein PHET_09260 [Paragonimus heterotremus]|uniref:Uncharacterized protein n=1 Tax=Paragonimus heterotremus TaxID=100268 RepID=A0A8J4TAZ1_9TREM|nr:hypothetical protein PHET_09260 [Paragonimus heterotremus]